MKSFVTAMQKVHTVHIWQPGKQIEIMSSLWLTVTTLWGLWQLHLHASACTTRPFLPKTVLRSKLSRFCDFVKLSRFSFVFSCLNAPCVLLVWVNIKILFVNGQMMDYLNWSNFETGKFLKSFLFYWYLFKK